MTIDECIRLKYPRSDDEKVNEAIRKSLTLEIAREYIKNVGDTAEEFRYGLPLAFTKAEEVLAYWERTYVRR
jgi:hypothetical protein